MVREAGVVRAICTCKSQVRISVASLGTIWKEKKFVPGIPILESIMFDGVSVGASCTVTGSALHCSGPHAACTRICTPKYMPNGLGDVITLYLRYENLIISSANTFHWGHIGGPLSWDSQRAEMSPFVPEFKSRII